MDLLHQYGINSTSPVDVPFEVVRRGWMYLIHELEFHPLHVFFDAVMIAFVIYFIRMPVHKAKDPAKERPTKEEEEELIAEFQSAPFEVPEREELPEAPVIAKYDGAKAVLENGMEVTNCSSFDFLAYATDKRVVETAQDTIVKYGCGSCGPRGFYGSLKPHLDLEDRLAKFTNTAAGIIYSFSFATISTLIPCFSARGDEIIVDEASHFAIQTGCKLSRSNVEWFRHNDMEHLEALMKESHKRQKKKGKRTPPRRTLIIEGIYRNTGTLARLKEAVALAKQYKYRIVLDDSLGFAALGKTGRGTPEHFGIEISEIEIYVGAMSTTLGTVGGFCVGAAAMIDHQRLAATGYVFSASLPPYASNAAIAILDILDADTSRLQKLQRNAVEFRKLFTSGKVKLPAQLQMLTDADSAQSPVVHFVVVEKTEADKSKEGRTKSRQRVFRAAERALQEGVMVTGVKYNDQERVQPPPSLRVSIKSELSSTELTKIANVVASALRAEFEN